MASESTVTVDDTDPQIGYFGNWAYRSGIMGEYNSTSHNVDAGATGTRATFKFTGTAVVVYGTVDVIGRVDHVGDPFGLQPPSSSFNVDGTSASTFIPELGPQPQYRLQFYQASFLSSGEHTLNIDVNVKSPFGSSFRLDYIEYTPPSQKAPDPNPLPLPVDSGTTVLINSLTAVSTSGSEPTSPTFTQTSNTISAATSLTGTPVFPVNSSNTSSRSTPPSRSSTDLPSGTSSTHLPSVQVVASNSSSRPIGAIIGGVIGALIFLLIVSLLLYIWQRKLRQARLRRLTLRVDGYPPEMFFTVRPPDTPKKQGIVFDNVPPPRWSLVAGLGDGREVASVLRVTDLPEYRSTV